jgi:PhnB protein
MAIRKISPYLNFDGNAEQAIKLYENVLGAKVETLSRFGDMPDSKATPDAKNRVLHALLRVGADAIMVSDTMPGMPFAVGTNVHLSLDFADVADMTSKFEALANGGQVAMPLQDTFWGARFGMLTDPFGIHWMFNCEQKKP